MSYFLPGELIRKVSISYSLVRLEKHLFVVCFKLLVFYSYSINLLCKQYAVVSNFP